MLAKYLDLPKKYAYPKMDQYRLAVSTLYPALSSSPQAFIGTIDVALNRLADTYVPESEKDFLKAEFVLLSEIKTLTGNINRNGKTLELLAVLKKALPYLRKLKLPQKAVVFATYRITQELLYSLFGMILGVGTPNA